MALSLSRCLAVLAIGFLALSACGGGGGGSTSSTTSGGSGSSLDGTWSCPGDVTLTIMSSGQTYTMSGGGCVDAGTQSVTSTQVSVHSVSTTCPFCTTDVVYNYTVNSTTLHYWLASGGCGSGADYTCTRVSQ